MGRRMDYGQAMDLLRSWAGRHVLVVAFVDPGVSLRPFAGTLAVEEEPTALRAVVAVEGRDPLRVAFPRATFHDASWVPGCDERGLSVVQGATRVDVFAEG